MKTKKLLITAVLLVFSISAAYSRDIALPRGKWWQNQRLVDRLQIDKNMITDLENQFYQSRMIYIDIKAEIDKARLTLEAAFDREPLKEDEVYGAFEVLEQARAKLAKERLRYLLFVRKTIGKDKFVTIKNIVQKIQKRRKSLMKQRKAKISRGAQPPVQ